MFLLVASESMACSCGHYTPSELISRASFIYAGTAIKAERIKGRGVKTTFEVIRNFKGITSSIEVVWSLGVGFPGCGMTYVIGKSHIVLANNKKQVSRCSGYDEYYPAKYDNSSRMDIAIRGILKELRKNDKHNQ